MTKEEIRKALYDSCKVAESESGINVHYLFEDQATLIQELFVKHTSHLTAEVTRLKQDLVCDVCAGNPGQFCACNGTGNILTTLHTIRQELFKVNKNNSELQDFRAKELAEVTRLREELENERMRHAACGVIAMSNTRESLKRATEIHSDYLSASVQDCIRSVTREIELMEENIRLREALKMIYGLAIPSKEVDSIILNDIVIQALTPSK